MKKELKKSKDISEKPGLANLLLGTGLLTEGALVESMLRSKTLTAMVVVGTILLLALGLLLFY